jgi:hypothetical protein
MPRTLLRAPGAWAALAAIALVALAGRRGARTSLGGRRRAHGCGASRRRGLGAESRRSRDDDADMAVRPAVGAHHHQIATARLNRVARARIIRRNVTEFVRV